MSGLLKWALAWVRIELVLARTTFRNSLGLASAKRFFLNSQIRLLVLLANSFAASFLPCVRNFLRLARRHFTKGVTSQHRVVPKWQFWPGHTADTDKIAYNLSVKGNQSVDANRLMILTQQTNDPGFTASLRLCQLAKQLKTHFSSVQITLLTYLLTYLLYRVYLVVHWVAMHAWYNVDFFPLIYVSAVAVTGAPSYVGILRRCSNAHARWWLPAMDVNSRSRSRQFPSRPSRRDTFTTAERPASRVFPPRCSVTAKSHVFATSALIPLPSPLTTSLE